MNEVKAVLTDIGQVVLAVHEERSAAALAGLIGLDARQIYAMVVPDEEAVARIYRGVWTMRDAHAHSGEPLRSAVSYEQFARAWLEMLGEDFPQVRRAFESLPASVPLYTLSNTNDLHLEWLRSHWLYKLSAGFYASCEIGMQKPDEEAFRFVLDRIGLPGGSVLFFDDNEENIAAAGRLGIRSRLVDHPDAVPQALVELGILPRA